MTAEGATYDLFVLVPDRNMEAALSGVLTRFEALGIRQVRHEVRRHPEHDPGCLLKSHEFLCIFRRTHARALVVFDGEGCGREGASREELEKEVQKHLDQSGWKGRSEVVVIAPELEVWVWSDSPVVDEVLGWSGRTPALRKWLMDEELRAEEAAKPERPKEALEEALRTVRKPRSSALYQQLAQRVSFHRCTDPAFLRLKAVLQKWFPEERT